LLRFARNDSKGCCEECSDEAISAKRAVKFVLQTSTGPLGNILYPNRHPPVTSFAFLLLFLLLAVPVVISACLPDPRGGVPWHQARRDPSGIAPDPATVQEAVIQVYAAQAVSWRGVVAVHTWIAVKPSGAPRFTRYEVVGFGVGNGAPAVRIDRMGPDNYWFGARPQLLLDRRGAGVDAIINRIRAAVASYPYPNAYRAWPGPNSNTFTAYTAREVPELGLNLPTNAIGKDFLPGGALVARAPSGTGFQLSVYGLAGVLVAAREGVEINVLGLSTGIDAAAPALKLPAIGRVGLPPRIVETSAAAP
jgi:hypothetical protein